MKNLLTFKNSFLVLLVSLSLITTYSCQTEDDLSIVKEESVSLDQLIQTNLSVLPQDYSLLIPPQGSFNEPTIILAPKGKESDVLATYGFIVIDESNARAGGSCGLSAMKAAKKVGEITDAGGCAQVKSDPGASGKYCVKKINCQ